MDTKIYALLFAVTLSLSLLRAAQSQSSKTAHNNSKSESTLKLKAEQDAIKLKAMANVFKLRLEKIKMQNKALVGRANELRTEAAKLALLGKESKRDPAYKAHAAQYAAEIADYNRQMQELSASANEYRSYLEDYRKHFQMYHNANPPELPNSIDIPYNIPVAGGPCGHHGTAMAAVHSDLVTKAIEVQADRQRVADAQKRLDMEESHLQQREDERAEIERRLLGH